MWYSHQWGSARAHLCTAAAVYIGAHGVVGAGSTHVEVCSVPGLDEPDEVPALTLGPEGKLQRGPKMPLAPPCPLPLPAAPLTLPSLPESTHSSMRCGEAAQWICQRLGVSGGHLLHRVPSPHLTPSRQALTMRGSRLMSCRSRDST